MGSSLPMFPLGTVTFPGTTLSLRVFEDRYLDLMSHLLALPEAERVFGTVAIREGFEVGSTGVQSAHRVGCEVLLTDVTEADDRLDIQVTARRRLRLDAVTDSSSFLWADVEFLPEEAGSDAEDAATRAHAIFEAYVELLASLGAEIGETTLPTDPLAMSYALSAGALLTLRDRQDLLEAPDAATRLRQVSRLLVAEMSAVRAVPSLPATDVERTSWSPN